MKKVVVYTLALLVNLLLLSCDLFRPFDHDLSDRQYDFAAENLDNYFLFREQIPEDLYAFETPKELYMAVNEPYTEYFESIEAKQLMNQLSTKSAGIGIRFDSTETGLLVKDVFSDAPAEKAGLKVLDTIVRIGDTDIRNMLLDEVYPLLIGDKGTTVVLRVKRRGEYYNVSITRDEYFAPSVFMDSVNPVTVNLLVRGFMNKTIDPNGTASEFRSALEKSDWAIYTIIDLRGNGGGYIQQCLQMLDDLVAKNTPIIEYKERTMDDKTKKFSEHWATITSEGEGKYSGRKLYVLVDGRTASASELMVSCLRERDNVVVVGDTTYGKARGQVLLEGPEGVLAKITCMKFTPTGITADDYDLVGIPPDMQADTVDAYEYALNEIEQDAGLAKRSAFGNRVPKCSDALSGITEPHSIVDRGN